MIIRKTEDGYYVMSPDKLSHGEPMNPTEETPKYDLTPDNFNTIQSLVFQRASEIQKTGSKLTKGRRVMQAENDIATVLGVTGNDLARWLGEQRAGHRIFNRKTEISFEPVLEETVQAPAPSPSIHVPQPHHDVDTFPKERNPRMDLITKLAAKMKPIRVGEVWSFPIANQEEGDYLMRLFTKASRINGWAPVPGKRYSYKTQRFHDKIKLKRLS